MSRSLRTKTSGVLNTQLTYQTQLSNILSVRNIGTNGSPSSIGSGSGSGSGSGNGATGPQGPAGNQGPTGPTLIIQGPTGSQGTQGIQGTAGPTGSQGIQGIQGVAGPTGGQGIQGIQGIQGTVGPAGGQGIQGIQGDTGPMGSQGIQGPIGPTGSQGSQGSQGIQGIQGDTGPVGPAGSTYTDNVTFTGTFRVPSSIMSNSFVVGKSAVTNSNYIIDVSGIMNATTVYENGVSIVNTYATKTDVTSEINTSINGLLNSAPSTLDTLGEIATALQSDASFGVHVYNRLGVSDTSVNTIYTHLYTVTDSSVNSAISTGNTNTTNISTIQGKNTIYDGSWAVIWPKVYTTIDGSINTLITKNTALSYDSGVTTSSFTGKLATIGDASFNGNVSVGGNSTGYGTLSITGNASLNGNVNLGTSTINTITSYGNLDMSGTKLSLFSCVEKISSGAWASTTLTLDFSKGSLFYFDAGTASPTVAANFTVDIINPETVLNRTWTVTLLIKPGTTRYYADATTINIGGTSQTVIKQDGTALSANVSATLLIQQFTIINATTTNQFVISYLSNYF